MNKGIKKYLSYMSADDITVWLKITKRRKKTVKALFEYFDDCKFYFNSKQLHQICLGLYNGLTKAKIIIYADDKFNSAQMAAIREGLERRYSVKEVKAYAKPELSQEQMTAIYNALRKGADIKKLEPYIDSKYNHNQLEVIGKAIIAQEPRIDLIANPEYTAEYMEAIRDNLEKYRKDNVEYYIERYAKKNFSPAQLYHILYYACDWFDEYTSRQIDFIANPKFDEKQMESVAEGFRYGLGFEEVKLYAKPELDYAQMHKIKNCLRFGCVLPHQIKPYINPKFNYKQLEEICDGLKKGYDVSIYAKECFDDEQMSVIFCALRDKVSKKKIDTILNPKLTPDEMRLILSAYRKGVAVEEIRQIFNEGYNENALKDLYRRQVSIIRNKELKELEKLLD